MSKSIHKITPQFSDSTQSPISFSTIAFSPIPFRGSIASKPVYKSPNNTPLSSPKTQSLRSSEDQFTIQTSKSDLLRTHEKSSVSKLSQKLALKEKQIRVLEEENKRLLKLKSFDKWEKELKSRNEEIRKLESQLNYFKNLLSEKVDAAKLVETTEIQAKKISELEVLVSSLRDSPCLKHESEVSKLKKENKDLVTALNEFSLGPSRDDWENLICRYSELEKRAKSTAEENARLMEEISRAKKEMPAGSLIYFSQDVSKIRKEIEKLLRIAGDIQKGKMVSLKGLLGIGSDKTSDPAQQLCKDIQSIKSNLNSISDIISDVLADNCSEIMCKAQ